NGSFTYTPAANFNGADSFTYKANDGTLDSNLATVTITVNAVNDAPSFDLTARVDVTLDTAALAGDEGQLAFDLIDGDFAIDNSVIISSFTTDGILGTASSTGSVRGDLPGRTTISDEEFFNELLQPITFGESIVATLHVTTNFAGGVPDGLSFFILTSEGTPLVTSDLPGHALFEVALGGAVSVAGSTSPDVPRHVTAPQGPAQTVDEDAGRQVVEAFAARITAGPADEARQGLTFLVSNNNAGLFAEAPAITRDGTLSYTP